MDQRISIVVTVAALTGGLAWQAAALPAHPDRSGTDMIRVEGGCGRGWHPAPGGCQRNWDRSWPCYWVRTPFGLRMVCN